jgi:hypothetical protein
MGFLVGGHPLEIVRESVARVGEDIITRAHPNLPWPRQFTYASEIGFHGK